MGAENKVAWTTPGGLQGPRRRCREGATTDESARGAEGYGTQPCHDGEYGAGASASGHPSDGGENDDCDDGESDDNGVNGENVDSENGWTSGWSARNGGDETRSDCVLTGRRTLSHSTHRY